MYWDTLKREEYANDSLGFHKSSDEFSLFVTCGPPDSTENESKVVCISGSNKRITQQTIFSNVERAVLHLVQLEVSSTEASDRVNISNCPGQQDC